MIFDFSKEKTYAVLLMAGKGNRIDPSNPKQFIKVAGRELFLYAAETLDRSPLIDYIIYVVPAGEQARTEAIINKHGFVKPFVTIVGASAREESAKLAIEHLQRCRCNPHSIIMIHDADRPNLTPALIKKNIEAAKKSGSAVTAVKVTDSLIKIGTEGKLESYVDRNAICSVQTPETFTYAVIYGAFIRVNNPSEYTDEGSLVLKTTLRHPEIVDGSTNNYKITTPEDLARFEFERNTHEPQ